MATGSDVLQNAKWSSGGTHADARGNGGRGEERLVKVRTAPPSAASARRDPARSTKPTQRQAASITGVVDMAGQRRTGPVFASESKGFPFSPMA